MIALFFICECIISKKELGGVSVVEYQRPWWDMRLCTKSIVIMIIKTPRAYIIFSYATIHTSMKRQKRQKSFKKKNVKISFKKKCFSDILKLGTMHILNSLMKKFLSSSSKFSPFIHKCLQSYIIS